VAVVDEPAQECLERLIAVGARAQRLAPLVLGERSRGLGLPALAISPSARRVSGLAQEAARHPKTRDRIGSGSLLCPGANSREIQCVRGRGTRPEFRCRSDRANRSRSGLREKVGAGYKLASVIIGVAMIGVRNPYDQILPPVHAVMMGTAGARSRLQPCRS